MKHSIGLGPLALALVFGAAACGRDAPGIGQSRLEARLRVDPSSLELYRGQAFRFDVFVADEAETRSVLGDPELRLEVDRAGLLEVTPAGAGMALGAGAATLEASWRGLLGRAAVQVRDATLAGLTVEPERASVVVGRTLQLRVTATLSDGSRLDVSRGQAGTTYRVLREGFASVNVDGLLRGLQVGATDVEVTHGGRVVRVPVEVGGEAFVRLEIEPETLFLEVGSTGRLRIFGVQATGARVDLLTDPPYPLGFETSDARVATVRADGLVTAGNVAAEAVITVRLGELSAEAKVSVRPSANTLVALDVRPNPVSVAVGGSVQLRVTGRYADGSTADLTAVATGTNYAVEMGGFIEVSATGLLSGRRAGETRLSVRHGPLEAAVRVSVGGEAPLIGIEVTPRELILGIGEREQLQVTLIFADGRVEDGTAASSGTTYRGPPGRVVTISPNGLVTGVFPGNGVIEVENRGFIAVARVTVPDGVELLGITISPRTLQVPVNDVFLGMRVSARLANGSLIDITSEPALSISTDNPRVATWSNGAVAGHSLGDTLLRASFFGFTDQIRVEVVPPGPQLQGISLQSPAVLEVGQRGSYTVTARYSDGSLQNVTLDPGTNVSVQHPNIAAASNGQITALAPGNTTVRANFGGFSDLRSLRVEAVNDPVVALLFQPSSLTLSAGSSNFVRLFARLQSGMLRDITTDPTVQYTTTGPVSVIAGPPGLMVTGSSPGSGTVRATYQGRNTTLNVTVTGPAPLVAIQLIAPSQLTLGNTASFFVVAVFADGSFQDVTQSPQLVMSATPQLVVFNSGLIVTQSAGTTTLRATYQGLTSSSTLRITQAPDAVVSLAFVPASLSLQPGGQGSFQVVATFASGATQDVSFDPLLTLNPVGPITLAPGAGAIQVNALSAGMAQVEATYQMRMAVLPISIAAGPTVTGLQIQSATSVQVGQSTPYTVIATFSDGSTRNVTADPGLSITVANPMILSAVNGAITGLAPGQTTLTASFGGRTANRNIQVTPANDPIVALRWTPQSLGMSVGQSGTARVLAVFASGNTQDITSSSQLAFSAQGPITFSVSNVVTVVGQAPGGFGQLVATTAGGISATLPVQVGVMNTIVGIRVAPAQVMLAVGATQQLQVFALFSDGSEQPVTGSFIVNSPMIATVSATGLVTGVSAGTAAVVATFGGFAQNVPITVTPLAGPRIISLNPAAITVSSVAVTLTVNGTGFLAGDQVFVNGSPLGTRFTSATQLAVSLPVSLVGQPGTLQVQVRGPNGRQSNIVTLLVGSAPVITGYSPDKVIAGSTIEVIAVGSGLFGLNFSSVDLAVSVLAAAPDGSWVRFEVSAPMNATPGVRNVTVSNGFGGTVIPFQVLSPTNLPNLVVSAGQTITLSGTNVFNRVTVGPGGTIVGSGLTPLVLISATDIVLRGTINVRGEVGQLASQDPAGGGPGGPGAAGGGGAGDGNAQVPASGGAGSPPGFNAAMAAGAGTAGGRGGGNGGGNAGSGGCARAGGGGGFFGAGGAGGGESGQNGGGAGGAAGSSGSNFGAGSGGGGGSTCGNASGGGGGGGGGLVRLITAFGGNLAVFGEIDARGGNGGQSVMGSGGGGAGAGGRIWLETNGGNIAVTGNIRAGGGIGGNGIGGHGGGGGGGGLTVLDARPGGSVNTGVTSLSVAGGAAGVSPGGNSGRPGSAGVLQILP